MLRLLPLLLFYFLANFVQSQTRVLDRQTREPISFATVSFGNGNGTFADDEGLFLFTKKLYSDVDSLHISSLGYKGLSIAAIHLKDTLFLDPKIDKLEEVFLRVKINRPFEEEKLKPYLDDDYYKCWLPTVESEIAVYFANKSPKKDTQISSVHIPIALESVDWKKRKKANAEKKSFSTLFKVNFYENKNNLPGENLNSQNIVFRVTEKNGDMFTLDVLPYAIYMPENGIFISIQVLGYTDKKGKLLPNKKYKEIKSRNSIVKIPTNFRPLLPFTSEIPENRTYIKRVFIHGNAWTLFSRESMGRSTLLDAGLNNYGMGISYRVFKDE
ncbi:MAG TPA: hypothetical protein VFF15_06045 [Flavobacteriaceae bacterium]|nr:hypothetical protein [Flavobacteriaceae bacterium]